VVDRAYALVPSSTLVEGSGCQERLLFYSREGVSCGELTLPFGGSSCTGRKAGIGLDGTVVQQIELNIPANDQCAGKGTPWASGPRTFLSGLSEALACER
jgi:hypothetical protein